MNLARLDLPDLRAVQRLLDSWRATLTEALRAPFLTGRGVVVRAAVRTTPTKIEHGLRGAVAGWMVLRAEGATAASVVELASDTKTLTLQASAAVTLTLWVWP